MKLLKWVGVAYAGILLMNVLGCECPHHHTEVVNERVVEQHEVVE